MDAPLGMEILGSNAADFPGLEMPRPLVAITGFLGAGKTTFLRGLLVETRALGLEADVILNDYENAEIDAESLRDQAAEVVTLSAACACCEGLEFLVEMAMAAAGSRRDLLAVELNGTADPLPLLEAFTLMESKLRLRPRWQVCVIDARSFGRRGRLGSLERLQLETASHFVIGHIAGLPPERIAEVAGLLALINPKASPITPAGMAASVLRARDRASGILLPRKRRAPSSHHLPDPLSGRMAHEFTGCQILLPPVVSREAMLAWLGSLPADVLRVKALVGLPGEPSARRLFERVGLEISPHPLEVAISERVAPAAICIGPDLEPSQLLQLARANFGPGCQLGNS